MALGNELKDFVSGFQAGYSMFKSKEEREWEREQRQMQRENHALSREKFDYGKERDAESDRRWGVEDSWRRERAGRSDYEWDTNKEWREAESGRQQGRWEVDKANEDRRLGIAENELRLKNAERQGAIPDVEPSGRNPYEQRGGASPASYSGEPRGGPAVATALVNDLQRDFGMPREIAVGIVGQLAAESGGFQTLQEINPMVPGSRGGYGYAQWTGPRRKQFEAFAKDRGLSPSSYAANYAFLKHELQNTSEGRVLNSLRKVSDPIEAGRLFTGSASSGRGFLRPGIVNQKGRDNWTRRIDRLTAQAGGRSVNLARGGMVSAIPDDEDEEDFIAEETPVQVAQALPEEGPMPSPRYEGTAEGGGPENEEPTNDPWEAARRSVRDGLKAAIGEAKFDVNSAIDDPELERMRQNYIRGYGAAPAGMMRQVLDKIDPDKQMRAGERNMMAMAEVYQFYMDRGDFAQAQEAAKGMLQYYRRTAQQFGALAQAAAQKGDMDNATKAAIAAYANIPNGRDLNIEKTEDGMYEVSVTDERSGERVSERVMDPKEFAELAMGFGPGTFDDEILAAVGAPPRQAERATLPQTQEMADSVSQYAETAFEGDDRFNPREQAAIRDIAVDLATNTENGLDAERSLRTAIELFDIDDARGEDGRRSNTKPSFTATKIPNSDLWQIEKNKQKFIVNSGTMRSLELLYGKNLERAIEEDERSIERTRRNTEIMDNFKSGIGAFGEMLGGAIPEEGALAPEGAAPSADPSLMQPGLRLRQRPTTQ